MLEFFTNSQSQQLHGGVPNSKTLGDGLRRRARTYLSTMSREKLYTTQTDLSILVTPLKCKADRDKLGEVLVDCVAYFHDYAPVLLTAHSGGLLCMTSITADIIGAETIYRHGVSILK